MRVLGANLYSPVFSQRFYLAEVRENAPAGSKVIQVGNLGQPGKTLHSKTIFCYINQILHIMQPL